ncbi:MAG: DUF4390 domain-containing protein [Gammaproteobacteria bacterium]
MTLTARLLFGWLLLFPAVSAGAGFEVVRAEVVLANDVYAVDAQFNYEFSPEALEALSNGVYLTVAVEIEMRRGRRFMWDKLVERSTRKFRLQRHELSGQYIVTDTSADTSRNHPSLEDALEALGHPPAMPVIRRDKLPADGATYLRVRTRLDSDPLPAPLKPIAFFKRGWRLSSRWYRIEMPP